MTIMALALTVLAATAAAPQARTDFSGTWVFDQEKTLQPGPDGKIVLAAMLGDRVVVLQDADTMTLRISYQGDVIVAIYDLTGAESRNTSPGDVPVISRASWKGDRLVIESSSEGVEQGTPITIRTTRVLWIDKAGDLIVERSGTPPSAVTPSRSVYRRSSGLQI